MTTVEEVHNRCIGIAHATEPTFDQLRTTSASVARAKIFRSLAASMKDIREVAITLPEAKRSGMSDAFLGMNLGILESLVEVEDARVNGTARRHVLAAHVEQIVGGIFDRMAEIPADSVAGLTDLFRELHAHATPGYTLAVAEGLLDYLLDRHQALERSAT